MKLAQFLRLRAKFINCPCFNYGHNNNYYFYIFFYGHKIYVCTPVKITRQWKSTLPLQFCLLKLIGEDPRGVGRLSFYFCPQRRVIGRLQHAASPPTNVARVVFKNSYNLCRLWVLPRMQAPLGPFNGSRSERGQGKGLCVPCTAWSERV